jgi:hypothetical protein
MPIIARDKQKEWKPAPEGLHCAVCVDVEDLGLKDWGYGEQEKIRISWQIEEISPENDKPYLVHKSYTLSLNEKANLRKDLETWRGRKFSREELEGFDLEVLLGVNCQLQLIHNMKDEGKTYANVQAVIPPGKNAPKLRPVEYTRVKDRDKQQETETEFKADDNDIPF